MDSNMCIAFILVLGAVDVSNSFPCVFNKTMDELKTFREKLKQFGIEIKNKFSGLDTDLQSMESDIASNGSNVLIVFKTYCNPKFCVPHYSELSLRLVPLAPRNMPDKKVGRIIITKETEEKQYVTRHCRSERTFEKYNGHCYYFGEDNLSWSNAQRKCQLIGGNLVKIDDSSENTWLISNTNGAGTSGYWIGLSDLVEGEFRWTNDQEVVSYKNFRPGKPDNAGGKEDCVYLYYNTGKWEDYPCKSSLNYICENNFCY